MLDVNHVQKAGVTDEAGKLLIALPETFPDGHFAMVEDGSPPLLSFAQSILTTDRFNKMEVPEDDPLVGSWWRKGARGFIYAQRGMGKTWMSMALATCLAEGRDCGPWVIPKARRVLYVDGEMSLKAMQERSLGLSPLGSPNFHFLSHYHHYNVGGADFNLVEKDAQDALSDVCQTLSVEVLFLDNLSCLCRGMREDKAEDWERVSGWLASFQPRGISTCIVHHAGREGGHMRGTTKREDNCDWIMGLKSPSNESESDAKYSVSLVASFDKNRRGSSEDEGPWRFTFETMTDGARTTVRHKLEGNIEVLVRLVKNGLELCGDIAEEMGLSKGRVSELANKAREKNLIRIENRKYLPPSTP